MSNSRTQNIFRTRSLLDDPFPQRPSLHKFVQQELSEEIDIINDLNNSGVAWATNTVDLVCSPNQDTYEINAEDFGKPLFVVKATNDVYVPYISVPFTDVNHLDYGQVWSDYNSFYGGLSNGGVTPEMMAFYRQGSVDSAKMVKIQPLPQMQATYTITYLVGYLGTDDPLESSILLPEHATLVQLRAALALLPYSSWHEDEELNRAKKKELMMSFQYQLERKERIYSEYRSNLVIPRMEIGDSWNEY